LELDSWSVVRHIYKLGSPMIGIVTFLDPVNRIYDIPCGFIHLDVSSEYHAILPYDSLSDELSKFNEPELPSIGDEIKTVVFNFVDGKLYLTADYNFFKDAIAFVTLNIGQEQNTVAQG